MQKRYLPGTTVRIKGRFRDAETRALTDPGVVRFKVKMPNGEIVPLVYGVDDEIVKDGVGIYHTDVDLEVAGDWHWQWGAESPLKAVAEGRIQVVAGNFAA